MEANVKKEILSILSKYNYKSIILFGSRARNDYNNDSDYDLLIIMNGDLSLKELREIQMSVRKELALKDIDADVLIKTQTIIDNYKDKKGNIIYNAIREGINI